MHEFLVVGEFGAILVVKVWVVGHDSDAGEERDEEIKELEAEEREDVAGPVLDDALHHHGGDEEETEDDDQAHAVVGCIMLTVQTEWCLWWVLIIQVHVHCVVASSHDHGCDQEHGEHLTHQVP